MTDRVDRIFRGDPFRDSIQVISGVLLLDSERDSRRKPVRRVICAITLVLVCGCGAPTAPTSGGFVLDLMDRVVGEKGGKEWDDGGTRGALLERMPVVRKGRREEAFVLVAPAVARASVSELRGFLYLEGLLAPVFNLGDGMRLEIFVRGSSERTLVYGRYFDPGRMARDREWIPFRTLFAAPSVPDWHIEIVVSGGPQGDLVGDWLAFNGLRLTAGN